MAALDFPASPTLNQTYTANGRTWTWDGTSWNSTPISNVIVSVAGTANEITATTVSGTTTLSLPSALTFTGKTITGGTFNSGAFNGTVGATTPSTVAATTINISNTNVGIAKWSGGDGLSFGGTNGTAFIINNSAGSTNALSLTSAGLGIGMTPSNVLDITQNQNASSTIKILNNSAGTGARVDMVVSNGTAQSQLTTFGTGYSGGGIFRTNGTLVYATGAGGLTLSTDTAQPIYFATNQTERARIDSAGNVGIGTSSPSQKLTVVSEDVLGGILISGNNAPAIRLNDTTNGSTYSAIFAQNDGSLIIGADQSNSADASILYFQVDGTERARIDSSGQLLLGTTTSSGKAFTIGTASAAISLAGTNGGIYFGDAGSPAGSGGFGVNCAIARSGGTSFHISGSVAGDFCIAAEASKSILFGTSASGSSLERVRIDASGNVGIGVTPSAWTVFKVLQIGSGFAGGSSGVTNARIFGNTYYDGSYRYMGTGRATQYEQDGYHAWYTAASGTAGNAITFTQAMTLDASGQLGIGTSSPTTALDVASAASDAVASLTATGVQRWQLKTERSTGNFLVYDQTGAATRLTVTSTGLAVTGQIAVGGSTIAASIRSTFTGNTIDGISLLDSADQSNADFAVFRKANSTAIGSIRRVTTTDAVAYNTTSDGRLKENLRDFTDSGRLIDSLKPRVFDWKNSDENGKNVVGFIAQEEHAADPIFAHIGAVSVGDEDADTITKQWQRSDSALIPILVAELKALRQRVAALETK